MRNRNGRHLDTPCDLLDQRGMTGHPNKRIRGRALQRTRDRIFTAACGLCAECARQGLVKLASELDHIKPVARGGGNDDDNLQPLCDECHKDKTARDEGHRPRVTIGRDGWPVA